MKKSAIVICSHVNSNRLKKKPFIKMGDKTILECLIERCLLTDLDIIVAVPTDQFGYYTETIEKYNDRVNLYTGPKDDPLKRTADAAKAFKVDTVVRICHDKIFVCPETINAYVKLFNKSNYEYLRDSDLIDGSGFEVISTNALVKASEIYTNVEHITYAIKECCNFYIDLGCNNKDDSIRLLIDYPEDLDIINHLVKKFGHLGYLREMISYLNKNPNIRNRNLIPDLTIYTCAYNAEKYISETIESIMKLHGVARFEYIVIDDSSTDRTRNIIESYSQLIPEMKVIYNIENQGLSTSSNIALNNSRGRYIMRIDADDYILSTGVIKEMLKKAKNNSYDVIYPNYFDDKTNMDISGRINHHVGGAIFNKSKLKELKFRDGLRHHDSLDIFLRAKEKFSIGYFKKPTFFYRNTPDSMSKSDLETRKKIENKLKLRY